MHKAARASHDECSCKTKFDSHPYFYPKKIEFSNELKIHSKRLDFRTCEQVREGVWHARVNVRSARCRSHACCHVCIVRDSDLHTVVYQFIQRITQSAKVP